MTAMQTVVFGILWVTLVVLTLLVYVAFRQIGRAQQATLGAPAALPVGSHAPPINVLDGSAISPYSRDDPAYLLAFVSTTCAACARFMDALGNERPAVPLSVVVSGNGGERWERARSASVDVRWLALPADAPSLYRINVVPTIYLIEHGKVAAVSTDGSLDGVRRLLSRSGVA